MQMPFVTINISFIHNIEALYDKLEARPFLLSTEMLIDFPAG
jgi:hypothetical protein